ncbi:S8 family serine peptidase [Ekhidna sp.]|jgi:subtilisin family serine protease|uniref:S8 family serine peptidase n=1 Tax=Ekhidna sp. TaxID=2608089 RepID=UPI0032EB9225
MKEFLPNRFSRMLCMIAFTLCALMGASQTYQNGAKKGIVKVKFVPSLSTSLSQMEVSTKNSGVLETAMKPFDAVAQNTNATNMYRLFPYDPKNEHKLIKHGLHLWYVIKINEGLDPNQAVAEFANLRDIAVAEVEHEKVLIPYQTREYTPQATATSTHPFNDPLLPDQWHYNNTGQSGYEGADVNLYEAWAETTGSSDIVVAIHDQGIDVEHEDLAANIWVNEAEANGEPNVDDDGNGYIDDINGYNFEKNKGAVDPQYHGTHVAGTIAAVNNNGIGVSGVAGGDGSGNGVKVMSLQILGGAAIEKSYVYAANNGAVISQNSWGYTSPGYVDQSVLDAIDYFIEEAGDFEGSPMKGGIVIFAAGNSNHDGEWYPGYFPNTMAVAAIGPEGKKASYSNYGDWIELSAPGGDVMLGGTSGVLSTIPDGGYAYLDGTSMACPHVSGIAALALANRTEQLTNDELWDKLLTGTTNIDDVNESYLGKLGTGAIDAFLSIQNDREIAPEQVTDLTVTGLAQEFATLVWTVPSDEDDNQPYTFELYHHTEPITASNLVHATKSVISNDQAAGSTFSYELSNLLGLTTYHFVLTATDRWGNTSVLSNEVSGTTNEGPSIAVDEASESITLSIDASVVTTTDHDITILNEAAGVLRWGHFMRHKNASLAYSASGINYPVVTKSKSNGEIRVSKTEAHDNQDKLRSNEPVATAYTSIEKSYAAYATNIIGETDLELTNSAAAKFYVSETSGFNLTQARMYLKHDPELGPVVMEVYKGSEPTKENLVYAQEHSNWSSSESWAYITLEEQLYFEEGETFWLAFHVPAGNLFPLGIGYESDPAYSTYCYMSFDLGGTWAPLEDMVNSKDFAWAISADSYNPHLGTYLSLSPGSGDVEGFGEATTTLTADGTTLVNGSYSANLVLASNDATQQEFRIPVNLTVSGHTPDINHIDIADYGSVFVGAEKTLELVLDNVGYGNFNSPTFNIDNPEFTIDGSSPWQIKAREEAALKVKFSPESPGNANGILEISNGEQTYQIALFGVGAATSELTLTPESQSVDDLTIGDVVNAQITVENSGEYPLKYFIPGYDEQGISDNWPTDYHSYGYERRTSYAEDSNPITYDFQDISATGIDITDPLRDDGAYATIDMGFDFPYYGQSMNTLYVAQKGFTTFDNSVRPVNTPSLNNTYSPGGYISPLGTFIDLSAQGAIYYQVEADRVIVQWDNVTDGYSGNITAQMVLFTDGNIRFYYDEMGFSSSSQRYLNILIESINKTDGILIQNYETNVELYDGLALGFDYPGPDIITAVANGSGILSPGGSAVVDVELATESLVEGMTNRYINFITNDPNNAQTSALVELNITAGGTAVPEVSTASIDFGDVFQGAEETVPFTIKNTGNADVQITGISLDNDFFVLTGNHPVSIRPGLYEKYEVQIPTSSVAPLADLITINYGDGSGNTIDLAGNVVDPPAISVDLSTLTHTLAHGETSSHPITIENTGLATLEVTPSGNQWLTFQTEQAAANVSYTYEKFNDGSVYQWIDIRETGSKLPFAEDIFDPSEFWKDLTLPFPITVYGQEYSEIKVGENGVISLEEDPDLMFFNEPLPTATYDGTYIMPYWTFGGFDTYTFPEEEVGIFYEFFDEKIIITWSYLVNNFGGMGDPISAQVIMYDNGTMKFQYKVEEFGSDQTSQFTAVGIQESGSNGIGISNQNSLDHGDGLAFVLTPTNTYELAPGSTMNAEIHLDAQNIYGGTYNESLMIETNVPSSESLEKPVDLTVTGEAVLVTDETVDFGEKVLAFEWGSPVQNYVDINISNDGSAPLDITWINMLDGTQGFSLQIYTWVDGWFGPELRWADITELYSPWAFETPVFTLNPNESLEARAVFGPAAAGDFTDELVLTTSLGEYTITMIGTGFEPPVFEALADPIDVVMNEKTETANRTIAINNLNGGSELEYEVSIDFGRSSSQASRSRAASVSSSQVHISSISAKASKRGRNAVTNTGYNRTISHTESTTPDTYVGTGGAAPFSVATKYNAGEEGFNISHVETWFRSEALTEGSIEVEIFAGGSSISDAVLLTTGVLSFTASGDDEVGDWYQIELNEAAAIYPNEDFYVVVTLPLGVEYPQGTITNSETVPNRYFYYSEGVWYDIQTVDGFATNGWLMFAAEEEAGNSSWLTISGETSGTLAVGEEGSINIYLEGGYAKRGDQIANVVITTNDSNNPEVSVPVTLHMNDAPYFSEIPGMVVVSENETETVVIEVEDMEGHDFDVASVEVYKGVTYTLEGGELTIELAPDFGDEGSYTYYFIATDEYDAEREFSIPVQVLHTNRAPQFVGSGLDNVMVGETYEYEITDLFSDPDNDEFTFSVSSRSTDIADVYSSEGKFLVLPKAVGSAVIDFVVTDELGASSEWSVDLTVEIISGLGDEIKFEAYPNPTTSTIKVSIPDNSGASFDVRIFNLTGVTTIARKEITPNQEVELDLSELTPGIYMMEVKTDSGKFVKRIIKK